MLNVDLRGIPPATAQVPVPESWYKVVIRKSNMKPTSKGDGGYLELICEIIEGAQQGRVVYWNLNLFNPSQQAVEIAYKTLSAIGHCIGVFSVQEQNAPDNTTPMLHNIPFYIWVVIAQGNQGPINNVKACKDINGNDPGKAMPIHHPTQSQPNFGGPAPAAPAPAWQGGAPTSGPQGGTAPSGFPGQPPAAPMAPGGGQWQPGTNIQPMAAPAAPAWNANPAQQQQQQQQPAQWQQGSAPAGPAQPQWSANPNPQAPNPFPPAAPTTFQAPPNNPAGAPTWQQNQQPGVQNPSAPWQRQ